MKDKFIPRVSVLPVQRTLRAALTRRVFRLVVPVPCFFQFQSIDPTTTYSLPNQAAFAAVLASITTQRPYTTGFYDVATRTATFDIALITGDSDVLRIDDQTTGASYQTSMVSTGREGETGVQVSDFDYFVKAENDFVPLAFYTLASFPSLTPPQDAFNTLVSMTGNFMFRNRNCQLLPFNWASLSTANLGAFDMVPSEYLYLSEQFWIPSGTQFLATGAISFTGRYGCLVVERIRVG